MNAKNAISAGSATIGTLYLLWVIGTVEQRRAKLEKDLKRIKGKNLALVNTFVNAFDRLSDEDKQKVMNYAAIEKAFAQLTEEV